MEHSTEKPTTSQKDWTKPETHDSELQKIFDRYGITVNQKTSEDQQEPTTNSGPETYQVQFLRKKNGKPRLS